MHWGRYTSTNPWWEIGGGCSAALPGAMNSLSWNCRGLGNLRSVRALQDMVCRWKPKIVFLMETKSKIKWMEKIKNRIDFGNGLIVPNKGRSGGVALLWTREVNLDISSYSGNHIDAIVRETECNFKWRITGFYGHLETHWRYESWCLLAFLHSQYQLPWLCLGDFNEILSITKKAGGATRPQQQMEGFRTVVNFWGFLDLGY